MPAITIEEAFQTASAFHQAGQLDAAEALYRQILVLQPDHAEVLHRLGTVAFVRGQYADAREWFQQAIQRIPTRAAYHSDLGLTLRRLGQLDDAIASLRHALSLDPDLPCAQVNLGEGLSALGLTEESISHYKRALELQPAYAMARNNLGNALVKLGLYEQGRQHLEDAIRLAPNDAQTYSNLANCHLQMERWDDAIACSKQALTLEPKFGEAHVNLGSALLRKGLFRPALSAFSRAVALGVDVYDVRQTSGYLLLLLGEYEQGWKEHEKRWQCAEWASRWRHIPAPRWDGTQAVGQTIWLHAEQGYGDTLQFARYVPRVRQRSGAAKVVLVCPPRLARLLEQSHGFVATILARESWDAAEVANSDRYLPLSSLPAALALYEPLSIECPYVQTSPKLRNSWRERISRYSGLRVGIAWSGSTRHTGDQYRSMKFEELATLFRFPGISYFNLQIDQNERFPAIREEQRLIDLTREITDFADTAALMEQLDLVISVDTATAHLAGTLGRPVWTLLPFVPDWRWGLERDDTPWYPTMRLFRQKTAGDWDEVIQRVAGELSRAVAAGSVGSAQKLG